MDGTTDRRHLTAARALVLDILAGASPLTSEQIVTEWTARQPDMSARHRQQLPRMLSEILWRLTNLEWVAHDGRRYRVSSAGTQMRTHLPAARDAGA